MQESTRKRNINIDIVKCLAVFFVISVHFFLNNNFYTTTVSCPRMHIMGAMRTFFMMCVPLFLLVTGYLMNKKELSLKYYKGLIKIFLTYFIISIITLIAKIFLSKYGIFPPTKLNHYINGFIDFNLIEYAWYVDLYIGLYLLIPFINKIFTNKTADTVFIISLLFLTCLPTICEQPTIIISQWKYIWPITYYAIGAYFAKYTLNISAKNTCKIFILTMLTFIIINILSVKGETWKLHLLDSWGGIENLPTASLFFLMIIKTNFQNIPYKLEKIINNIAQLTLGIYLSSYMFDSIVYYYFNQYVTNTAAKLEWYFVIVPFIFICSLIIAKFSDKISSFIRQKCNF